MQGHRRIGADGPQQRVEPRRKPLDREAGALVAHDWREAEQESQRKYYFPLCEALPTFFPTPFSATVDWRARYFGVKESRKPWDDVDGKGS